MHLERGTNNKTKDSENSEIRKVVKEVMEKKVEKSQRVGEADLEHVRGPG